jgi:hypothetical protein
MKSSQASVLLISIAGLLATPSRATAEEPRQATTTARWSTDGKNTLNINVSDLLTPAQRDIVNSGFSTFTLFAITTKKLNEQDPVPSTRVICSVKYDTWEERYQLIKVEPGPPQTSIATDYKAWADQCLSYSIHNDVLIESLGKTGSQGHTLTGILQIRQSSHEEAAKIKTWLVRQQSGFMQGLYAHMLGDFQFRGTVRITITIPPKPTAPSEDNAPKAPMPKKGHDP